MSKLLLDVTELLKVVCPCLSTFTLCRSLAFYHHCSMQHITPSTQGQTNTVLKEKTTNLSCSLQKSGGLGVFLFLFSFFKEQQRYEPRVSSWLQSDEQEQDTFPPLPARCYISDVPVCTELTRKFSLYACYAKGPNKTFQHNLSLGLQEIFLTSG